MGQTNLRTHYFKVIEHGTKLFNAHRLLNTLAFVVGLVGMIVILTAEEEVGGWVAWCGKSAIFLSIEGPSLD